MRERAYIKSQMNQEMEEEEKKKEINEERGNRTGDLVRGRGSHGCHVTWIDIVFVCNNEVPTTFGFSTVITTNIINPLFPSSSP